MSIKNKLLYSVVLLIHKGLNERQITDKLTSEFTQGEVKNALLALKAKGFLAVKEKSVLPKLAFISFLKESLSII